MSTTTTRRTLGTVLALPLTLALGVGLAVAQAPGSEVDRPSGDADQRYEIAATPEDAHGGGQSGASGQYDLDFYFDDDVICHDITFTGLEGDDFSSPAPTSNHIHQGLPDLGGPFIWTFPDPEMSGTGSFTTSGCITDAFNPDNDIQSVEDIVAAPANRYVDIHRGSDFSAEPNVRGNFLNNRVDTAGAPSAPSGEVAQGPDAGFGGATQDSRTAALTAAILALALAGAATASQFAGRRQGA